MITEHDRQQYPRHSDNAILGKKLIGGLTDDALQLWLDDPSSEHPILQALMTLMCAGDRVVDDYWVWQQLAQEALERKLIDKLPAFARYRADAA